MQRSYQTVSDVNGRTVPPDVIKRTGKHIILQDMYVTVLHWSIVASQPILLLVLTDEAVITWVESDIVCTVHSLEDLSTQTIINATQIQVHVVSV